MLFSKIFRRCFSAELPFFRFCWNLIVLSSLSILPLLLIYVARTPEFAMMLLSNSTAFSRFFRQVVTNGLPVVFLVNYLGFVAVSLFLEKKKQSAIQFLALEGFVRGVTFVGLHVLVYVLSADLFGSFGGNRGTALRVVGPTLERSFLFENISGVYLYALLPGVFIGHAAVLSNLGSVTGNAARTLIKFAALASCLFPILVVTALSAGLAQLFRVPG